MSLDFNTTDCPGNKVTSGWCGPEARLHPDTNSMAWGAFCGFHVPVITLKNIDEVFWRIEFLKRVNLPWMSDGSYPSPAAIDQHLGFRTNCDFKTRKKWLEFVSERIGQDVSINVRGTRARVEDCGCARRSDVENVLRGHF